MKPVFISRTAHAATGWLLLAVVTVLSLTPAPSLPPVSASANDKLMHTLIYAVLMLWFAVITPRARWLGLAGCLCLYGIALEFGQLVVPTRSASLADAVANALGIILGACAAHLLITGLDSAGRAE